MNNEKNKATGFQLRRSRVVLVYVACFIGASLAPLESYLSTGTVSTTKLVIALLAMITGAAVATFAMWQLKRKGRFLHYEIKD
ncbi:MAG: hypothetical protein PsegKO_07290 [Pseudohongiellaceae bacterium]|jgi:hypothetical protein